MDLRARPAALQADIDFARRRLTTFGRIGVKVWITGEHAGKSQQPEAMDLRQRSRQRCVRWRC
jgi:ribosomal protein S3